MQLCLTLVAGLVAVVVAHFRWDSGDGPTLQIAKLSHDSVSFFARNLEGAVDVRAAPSVDLWHEASWRESFLQSGDRGTSASHIQPASCYAYRGRGQGRDIFGAFCSPPSPEVPSPSFRGFFGSCLAVSQMPPFHRLRSFEWAWDVLRPSVAILLGDLVYLDIEERILGWLRVPASMAWRRTWRIPSSLR